ncbi:MAG TPA: 30S ribosomal protein S6 [Desulfobacterales bacterium]|nr:30S ribosomal protein S6 [Desulfobacterales bacterium]
MRFYETLYLLPPDLSDDEYQEVVEKFNSIIEKNQGVIVRTDHWGRRDLAYRVRKYDKGYYVLMQFCGNPGITSVLERDLRLDDRVMKFHTVKLAEDIDPETVKEQYGSKEEIPQEPQAQEKVESEGEVGDGLH